MGWTILHCLFAPWIVLAICTVVVRIKEYDMRKGRPGMKYKVGSWTYTIRKSTRVTPGLNGDCAPHTRNIVIRPDIPIEQMVETLFYILWLAWEEHFGTPMTTAERASRAASFT